MAGFSPGDSAPRKGEKTWIFGRFHQHLRNTNCNFWMHISSQVRIMIGNTYLAKLAQCNVWWLEKKKKMGRPAQVFCDFPTFIVSFKKKNWEKNPMINFSRWPCKLGSSFNWDSQKGLQKRRIVQFCPRGKYWHETPFILRVTDIRVTLSLPLSKYDFY